jgi:hypothetical protein
VCIRLPVGWVGRVVLFVGSRQACLPPSPSHRNTPSPPPPGFHTFDYARHFLSCCSRMLGLEHQTTRGSISVEYYGRNVGIKIMPTGGLMFWGGGGGGGEGMAGGGVFTMGR